MKNTNNPLPLKARSLKLAASHGFAMIELLIATILFGIIATFILLAYNKVGTQLSLTSLAYELALSFRQAQSYGVSVHGIKRGGEATFDFNVGYGLHFVAANLDTYALFADQGGAAGNGKFDGTFGMEYDMSGCLSDTECVSVFRLEKGNSIYKFCGVLSDDGGRDAPPSSKHEECNGDSTPPQNPASDITFLDVTFVRPNPDAIIKTSQSSLGTQYKAARVYLTSPDGDMRVIEVVNTGQISLK